MNLTKAPQTDWGLRRLLQGVEQTYGASVSETFGARFVHEIRRLTNSSWGLGYKELVLADGMDREAFLETFAPRLIPFGSDWLESHRQLTAEDLARAVIQEGEARAKSAGARWDPFDLLVDLLGGFS